MRAMTVTWDDELELEIERELDEVDDEAGVRAAVAA